MRTPRGRTAALTLALVLPALVVLPACGAPAAARHQARVLAGAAAMLDEDFAAYRLVYEGGLAPTTTDGVARARGAGDRLAANLRRVEHVAALLEEALR